MRMGREKGADHGWTPMDTDGGSVVARRDEPGAVCPPTGSSGAPKRSEWSRHDLVPVLMLSPGSPRRATAGKTAENRDKRADFPENAGFQAEIRDFSSKNGQNRLENAVLDPLFAFKRLRAPKPPLRRRVPR